MSSTVNLTGPALTPPDGVIPDFENHGGNHVVGYTVVILGIIISTFSVVLHLANKTISKKFGLVEFLLIAAWGQYLGFQAVIYRSAVFGISRHQWNFQLKDVSWYFYNVFVATTIYGTCMMCLKLAILVNWLHIFVPSGQRNALFWWIHALIWSNAIFFIVGLFADIFQCTPMEKIWNPLFEGGNCPIDIGANNFSAVLVNLASDLAILALPQWTIWHLNMSRARKVGVSLLFAIGLSVCVLGALRLISLVPLISSDDQAFWISILGVYSSGEIGVGFLIIGLPSLPKVFHHLPFSESMVNLLHSATSSGKRWTPNLQSLSLSRRKAKRRGLWEITELEETAIRTQPGGSLNGDSIQSAYEAQPGRVV